MHIDLSAFITLALANIAHCWDRMYNKYGNSIAACQSHNDCDFAHLGQTCLWFYEGCDNGQCRCDPPLRTVQLKSGKCVSVKFGSELCEDDVDCKAGMHCRGGRCKCKSGNMTADKMHCLHHREKLLGQACNPSIDTCLQIEASGYTRNRVDCSMATGKCECLDGVRTTMNSCRAWKLDERGCSRLYHCTGGAICVDEQCVCPHGYTGAAGGTKCVRRNAVRDLPLGAKCDESNDRLYCAQGLICHKCSDKADYRCVRFMPYEMAFFSSDSLRCSSDLPTLLILTLLTFLFTQLR